ncbi:MAG: primosomal protein N' (replication factor Y) [Phenylobacterium sp.]
MLNHLLDIIKVAVPVPLRRLFDYALPDDIALSAVLCGQRALVPFGTKQLVGIVIAKANDEDETYDIKKIKPLIAILDPQPVFDQHLNDLLQWSVNYYQHPIGDVYATALPALLRENKSLNDLLPDHYQLSDKGRDFHVLQLGRSEKQKAALTVFKEQLQSAGQSATQSNRQFSKQQLKHHDISAPILKALIDKELVTTCKADWQPFEYQSNESSDKEQPLTLNVEQSIAVTATCKNLNNFYPALIEGVTGSGKTEVYLQIIEQVLQSNRQVLVLVPEIGLTPQTLSRFEQRFDTPISLWHSGLNNTERFNTWLDASKGQSAITIGTRSSIFLPFNNLGLIVIDEEHDMSFKQQDSFRYNARDLAIYRAKMLSIPIILGTATPSLESLKNSLDDRYHSFTLPTRISGLKHQYNLIDIKGLHLHSGLSMPLIERIDLHLKKHNQVMLFLNRRGYAPAILCHECSWICECKRCSAFYTLHKANHQLICHHCGSHSRIPHQCPDCGTTNVQTVGQGTEQLEEKLTELFPDIPISRLDRDSTRRKGSFQQRVDDINQPGRRIIIGTQMIAKGHHFPNVTMVAVMDVDGALFSADFRASERLAQLLIQVSGRAGRGSQAGEITLQTHFPGHPLLQDLIHNGYGHFSRYLLTERKDAVLPPYVSQLLFRAQAAYPNLPKAFLDEVRDLLTPYSEGRHIEILGPLPAPMEKKAGKFRFQLLIQTGQSGRRGTLQSILKRLIPTIEGLKSANKVRWSLDIDPMDMN